MTDKIIDTQADGWLGARLLPDKTCPSCGREYDGPYDDEATHCSADDDCPSFFEERGIAHPDHPRTSEMTATITHYTVTNRNTGKVTTYKTGRAASNARDRMDMAYGAVICTRRAHWSDEK